MPIFIILLLPFQACANFYFNKKIESGYQEFLKLKIDNGQKFLEEALKEDPNNGIAIYMANYSDAIRLFISEDAKLYKVLSKNEDIRINKISKLNKKSPYYLFSQAEIRLQWAFIKLKFGEEVNAMLGLRQAYKLLEENIKLYPDFIPNKKSMGLLNIVIGSIPSNYSWALSLIGMEGNINKGVVQLNEVIASNSLYNLETSIIKNLADHYILNLEVKNLSNLEALYKENSDNLLINYVYSAILVKNAQGANALEIANNRPMGSEYIYFPQMQLISAELYLYKGDYSLARNHYIEYLNKFSGKNTIKNTYFKIFLTYWLSDEDEKAIIYFKKIPFVGQKLYDSDHYAQKIAESKEYPDKNLTKIRLFSDGGYYDKAFEVMKTISLSDFRIKKDKLEYFYRIGRLYHKSGKINDAITYYQKTIQLTTTETYYFAPNASLQLGYIYLSKGDKGTAQKYFNKALNYKNHEYKNSIDNKAKIALNDLKQP